MIICIGGFFMANRDTVNRYQCQNAYAYLNTDFGLNLACKKFNLTPDQLKELVGVYSKGKRKGQLKGQIVWLKVIKGGWVKTGAYDHDTMTPSGFVVKPGVCFAFQIIDPWSMDKRLILNHPDTVPDTYHSDDGYDRHDSLIRTINAKTNKEVINENV
jgi:hypothetical protein